MPAGGRLSEEDARMLESWQGRRKLIGLGIGGWLAAPGIGGTPDPFADGVIDYDPGNVSVDPYNNPQMAIGMPALFSPAGQFSTVVSMFAPAYLPEHLTGIGEGGWLVVEFEEPITNAPDHLFGVDLIVFGNAGFVDTRYPDGQTDSLGTLFGLDPMQVSVSADGQTFVPLGNFTEGLWPTQAYLDVGPQSPTPGQSLSDFTRPMDPALTQADFADLSFAQAMALYDGSGGGTPIDISSTGLSSVRFVRIDVPEIPDGDIVVDIDAFAAVPEPGTAALTILAGLGAAFRRKLHS
jgi:hypothetical protein